MWWLLSMDFREQPKVFEWYVPSLLMLKSRNCVGKISWWAKRSETENSFIFWVIFNLHGLLVLSLMFWLMVLRWFLVLRRWQYYHTKYFRCSICASLIKSTRFKSIFLRDGDIEEPQFSIFILGRRVDTEFIFVGEFSCSQKSTLGVEDGSEDHANDSCCKWRIHFLW